MKRATKIATKTTSPLTSGLPLISCSCLILGVTSLSLTPSTLATSSCRVAADWLELPDTREYLLEVLLT